MENLIKELTEYIESIIKTPTITREGRFIVNINSANNIEQCALKFAEKIKKDYNYPRYDSLVESIDKIFVRAVDSPENCIVNNMYLGYLDATIDLIKSDIFKSKITIKKPKIFISHSSKDIKYVKPFVEMLEKIGLSKDNLFCSSVPGFRIPLGEDIYDYLHSEFENNSLYVIFILSTEYYKSSACLNEMGAAWALKSDYQAILLPKFDFPKIDGAINPRKVSFNLDDKEDRPYRLAELKNNIITKLNLPKPTEENWDRYRADFFEIIDKINIVIRKTHKGLSISQKNAKAREKEIKY